MTITINIDDSAAKEVLQNIALSKGWISVSDDEARILLGQDIGKTIAMLARSGQTVRKRAEEQAAIDASLAKVSVS